MLVRWNPFREFNDLQNEMNRVFDVYARRGASSETGTVWTPAVDVHEDENNFVIHAELPGLSRDDVELHLEPPRSGAGKWANLNAMLAEHPPDGADWLLLVDDDVRLPRGFLDAFVLCAERFGLRLAQPAHAFASHAAWEVTRRRPGLLARTGRFVEIGPVTALHRDAVAALLPFPELRMGWGLDAHWSAVAAERGLPVGIVDVKADIGR